MVPEVIVIGAGIAGMSAALRLQARGVPTLTLEAFGQVGGCAGFFRRRGFAFDVGATTFVDFAAGGVGGQFLAEVGLPPLAGEILPGYRAWLPDRTVGLYRDQAAWQRERLVAFGDTPAHRRFWDFLDRLAATFWRASRAGIKLPLRAPGDLLAAARALTLEDWPLVRYLRWSFADALAAHGLAGDQALRGLFSMLLQDTVHASPEAAPLINGALGVTIRAAGLTRPAGGACGFWQTLVARYRELGGVLRVGTPVNRVARAGEAFVVGTRRGEFSAPQVISTLPIWDTARLGPPEVGAALRSYLERDAQALGGAAVLFLGVPEEEVAGQDFTHHQVLVDYRAPLKDGNTLFISVSAAGDALSAPIGYRAVMISTHCDLADWEGLSEEEYLARKVWLTERLLTIARRVYPQLGTAPVVCELGTPRTYARYTGRYRGAVGGLRLNLRNSNQGAVAYATALPGFWLAGDTTWPGLGTVAGVLGSRHVAELVIGERRRRSAGASQCWCQPDAE